MVIKEKYSRAGGHTITPKRNKLFAILWTFYHNILVNILMRTYIITTLMKPRL